MDTNSHRSPRDRAERMPAQIAACLVVLQSLILRTTSGHGQGGTRRAYIRRYQLRRALDYRHLFHWQLLRGATAIGIGDRLWLPEIRDLVTYLCDADGIRWWIDPTHQVANELIAAGAASFAPACDVRHDTARLALMREATALAPTVSLDRLTTSPVVIFTPAWADYLGSTSGRAGNDSWLDLVHRLSRAGFRVVILVHDVYAFGNMFPGFADHVLPLRGVGPWVFDKLCKVLCGYSRPRPLVETGAFFSAASPSRLNAAWRPGSSPEVFRLRVLEAFADERSRCK